MTQNTLIVSNWKMNLDLSGAKKLIYKLKKLKNIEKTTKNIICPQFLLIPMVSELIKNSNIILGAQDCHYCESGSFTGDSSVSLIKKYKCKFVIVGHSERRINHNEKDEIIKKKIILVNKFNLSAIVCVGEPYEVRKKKNHVSFILNQLNQCIPANQDEIIIAYEPIWSIGSGKTPTLKDILEIKKSSVSFLKEKKKIKTVSFLYGGSVNSENLYEIINKSFLNGALIGGASLIEKEITKILKTKFN